MKKIITTIIMLIALLSSFAYAVLIDVNTLVLKTENLAFPDLLTVAKDKWGHVIEDQKTGQTMYKYHKASNEIIKASSIGLLEGYEDGTFRPDNTISKAEFIKLAINLSTNRNFDFSAIPTTVNHWSAPYVAVAEMQNVIEKGAYNDHNLNEPITRIEMICILSKIQINMKGISQYRDAELPAYIDIDTLTEEEKELLLHAARYELMSDMFERNEDGKYVIRPYDGLTRGEAAMAIMRIY